MSTQSTQELIDGLAIELNEDAARIRVHQPIWTRYAQQGVVIDLHCEREQFKVALTFDDLGIRPESDEEGKALSKVLALGSRYLIPREWVAKGAALDSKGRETLKRHAFKTFWGYWIHTSTYATWRSENDEIQAAYFALRDEIIAKYDDLIQEARLSYVGLCSQAYNRLAATAAGREGRIPGLDDRERWIGDAVARMIASSPSPSRIYERFKYYWDVTVLPLQQQVAEDEARANQIRLDAATAAMLEDIKRTEARKAAGGIQQFVTEVQAAIRSEVYDATITCLEALEGNDDKLPGNNTAQLKRLVEKCSRLVFWEDPDLEKRVREVSSVVSIPSAKRSPSELKSALRALGAEARIVLLELDRPPERSGADLGIPDLGADLTVVARRSQNALDDLLDDVDFTPITERGAAQPAAF